MSEFRSDPVSHGMIPPTAGEGIVRSIFWHPEAHIHKGEPCALGVEVQALWLLNPIKFTSFKLNEVGKLPVKAKPCVIEPRQTSVVAVKDAKYLIQAVYVGRTPEVVEKAANIFHQRLRRNQSFRQPCLGRRRYMAFFREPNASDVPLDVDMDLGSFPWKMEYLGDRKQLRNFKAVMRRGVVAVPSWYDHVEQQGGEVQL
jgi:hypothetical protein